MPLFPASMPPSVRIALYIFAGFIVCAFVSALGWLGYMRYEEVQANLAATRAAYEETQARLAEAEAQKAALSGTLVNEQARSTSYAGQIKSLSSTVDTLDKLVNTDPELLKKYSKVYFLNENYTPTSLTEIESKYLLQRSRDLEFHAQAYPFLVDMIEDADDDDVTLLVVSAYRSFKSQTALKNSYTVKYGSGANTFSADQGYSEHQMGTTVDLTDKESGATLTTAFDQTEAFKWLNENAWKYGFVLSYPKGNAYYQYEPWHWRFVGVALATELHKDKKNFYDLDQRELDEYLLYIFD